MHNRTTKILDSYTDSVLIQGDDARELQLRAAEALQLQPQQGAGAPHGHRGTGEGRREDHLGDGVPVAERGMVVLNVMVMVGVVRADDLQSRHCAFLSSEGGCLDWLSSVHALF